MRSVAWTPEALARLEDIEAYIANDAPIVAKEVITRLLERDALPPIVAAQSRGITKEIIRPRFMPAYDTPTTRRGIVAE